MIEPLPATNTGHTPANAQPELHNHSSATPSNTKVLTQLETTSGGDPAVNSTTGQQPRKAGSKFKELVEAAKKVTPKKLGSNSQQEIQKASSSVRAQGATAFDSPSGPQQQNFSSPSQLNITGGGSPTVSIPDSALSSPPRKRDKSARKEKPKRGVPPVILQNTSGMRNASPNENLTLLGDSSPVNNKSGADSGLQEILVNNPSFFLNNTPTSSAGGHLKEGADCSNRQTPKSILRTSERKLRSAIKVKVLRFSEKTEICADTPLEMLPVIDEKSAQQATQPPNIQVGSGSGGPDVHMHDNPSPHQSPTKASKRESGAVSFFSSQIHATTSAAQLASQPAQQMVSPGDASVDVGFAEAVAAASRQHPSDMDIDLHYLTTQLVTDDMEILPSTQVIHDDSAPGGMGSPPGLVSQHEAQQQQPELSKQQPQRHQHASSSHVQEASTSAAAVDKPEHVARQEAPAGTTAQPPQAPSAVGGVVGGAEHNDVSKPSSSPSSPHHGDAAQKKTSVPTPDQQVQEEAAATVTIANQQLQSAEQQQQKLKAVETVTASVDAQTGAQKEDAAPATGPTETAQLRAPLPSQPHAMQQQPTLSGSTTITEGRTTAQEADGENKQAEVQSGSKKSKKPGKASAKKQAAGGKKQAAASRFAEGLHQPKADNAAGASQGVASAAGASAALPQGEHEANHAVASQEPPATAVAVAVAAGDGDVPQGVSHTAPQEPPKRKKMTELDRILAQSRKFGILPEEVVAKPRERRRAALPTEVHVFTGDAPPKRSAATVAAAKSAAALAQAKLVSPGNKHSIFYQDFDHSSDEDFVAARKSGSKSAPVTPKGKKASQSSKSAAKAKSKSEGKKHKTSSSKKRSRADVDSEEEGVEKLPPGPPPRLDEAVAAEMILEASWPEGQKPHEVLGLRMTPKMGAWFKNALDASIKYAVNGKKPSDDSNANPNKSGAAGKASGKPSGGNASNNNGHGNKASNASGNNKNDPKAGSGKTQPSSNASPAPDASDSGADSDSQADKNGAKASKAHSVSVRKAPCRSKLLSVITLDETDMRKLIGVADPEVELKGPKAHEFRQLTTGLRDQVADKLIKSAATTINKDMKDLTVQEVLQAIPSNLECDQRFQEYVVGAVIPDDHPNKALRGQLGVRVAAPVPKHTIVGHYTGYHMMMREFDAFGEQPPSRIIVNMLRALSDKYPGVAIPTSSAVATTSAQAEPDAPVIDLPGPLSDGLAKLAYVHDRHGMGLAKQLAAVCTTLHLDQVEVTPAAAAAASAGTVAAGAGDAAKTGAGGSSKHDSKTDSKKRKRDDADEDDAKPGNTQKKGAASKAKGGSAGPKTKDNKKGGKESAKPQVETRDVLRAVAPVTAVLGVLWRAMWSELLSDGSHREQEIELPSELKDVSNTITSLDDPILEKWLKLDAEEWGVMCDSYGADIETEQRAGRGDTSLWGILMETAPDEDCRRAITNNTSLPVIAGCDHRNMSSSFNDPAMNVPMSGGDPKCELYEKEKLASNCQIVIVVIAGWPFLMMITTQALNAEDIATYAYDLHYWQRLASKRRTAEEVRDNLHMKLEKLALNQIKERRKAMKVERERRQREGIAPDAAPAMPDDGDDNLSFITTPEVKFRSKSRIMPPPQPQELPLAQQEQPEQQEEGNAQVQAQVSEQPGLPEKTTKSSGPQSTDEKPGLATTPAGVAQHEQHPGSSKEVDPILASCQPLTTQDQQHLPQQPQDTAVRAEAAEAAPVEGQPPVKKQRLEHVLTNDDGRGSTPTKAGSPALSAGMQTLQQALSSPLSRPAVHAVPAKGAAQKPAAGPGAEDVLPQKSESNSGADVDMIDADAFL